MTKRILEQDTNDRVLDRNQMLMAQLLFTEKPDMADPNALKEALERSVGAVGNISDRPDMPMFSVPKYKAIFKDAPQGMPPLADYLAPREFGAENIDELKRSQFWDFKDGAERIDGFKWCVDVFAMMAAGLHYKEQAELFLAQVDAALRCYPTCEAIYVLHSGKLTTPEDFENSKQFDLSGRFIRLAVNARYFTVNGTDDMIVDTIGFFAFGAADVQVHFHGMNPDHVVNYVYNIASYQFDNEFPIESGETVDSLDENGQFQWEPQWRTQYEDSLIQPVRCVLDINCGEFASGSRQQDGK